MVQEQLVLPQVKWKDGEKELIYDSVNQAWYYLKSGGYMAKKMKLWMVIPWMLLVDGMLRIKPNITKLNQSLPMSIVHLEKF